MLLVCAIITVGTLTGCGSSNTPSNPPTPSTTAPATPSQNADGCPAGTSIPQGGGDNDSDNSGGPSDGDGCL